MYVVHATLTHVGGERGECLQRRTIKRGETEGEGENRKKQGQSTPCMQTKAGDDSMQHNMRNPLEFTDVGIWGYACYVACYRPLPLSACMVYFDLVSILFGTSIPTSFNILVKMFLHLFHCFF